MTWRILLSRLASPWLWAGLWMVTVLALLVGWHVYRDYRHVAEYAYAHPATVISVTRDRWHTRTVLGPERITTREVIKYLRDGTTEIYHSTTTSRAQSIVDVSSVTVSSVAASTPLSLPIIFRSSESVSGRWYGVLGWHPGTGIAGVQYAPARLPVTGTVGITTHATPYVAVGIKIR